MKHTEPPGKPGGSVVGRGRAGYLGIGGTGGNVNVNAPRSLLIQIMGVSTFGFIVTAALLGNTVYRDIESRIHPLFFTTPVTKAEYLGGRGFEVVTAPDGYRLEAYCSKAG